MAIIGCKDRKTERFLAGQRVPEFQAFAEQAQMALTKIEAASVLGDLRNPPSNNFEAMRGDRKGQWSIRINRRWRVCFLWAPHVEPEAEPPKPTDILFTKGNAYEVEICDPH
jgi:proteic killer suppression protein